MLRESVERGPRHHIPARAPIHSPDLSAKRRMLPRTGGDAGCACADGGNGRLQGVVDSCGLPSERWDVEVGDVHELDVDGEERSTVIRQMEAGNVLQHEEGCADEMDGDECEESTVEIAQLDLWSRGNVVSAGMVWIRCRSTRRQRRHADLTREGRQCLL